jgi:cellulose synthase operon protein C
MLWFERRFSQIHSALLLAALSSGVLAMATGCAAHPGHAQSAPVPYNAARAIPAVGDEAFAQAAYKVLVNGDLSPGRASLLMGVVRRQLQRAKARFDAGQREAGLNALIGAFYLMRAGEFRDAALDGAEGALSAGAAEVARLGQEGYAITLYTMLQGKLPPGAERQEVEAHLEAMTRFSRATRGAGPMQAAGADLRAATQQSLIEARKATLDQASDLAVKWLKRALASNAAEAPMNSNADRDETFEAYRALRGGGYTLIALYLRHGDARGVLTAAEHAEIGRIIAPELRDRLERAAQENDADAWADLCHFFDSASHAADAEGLFDHSLMEAAAWGSAVQLFRAEPGSMRGAVPLATELVNYGMAEVAPLVLAPALTKEGNAENLSFALGIVGKALVSEDELDQLSSARRTFGNAQPILALAENKANLGHVSPSSTRLRYVMGALETRHGELDRALPLVQAAVRAEPSLESLMTLAAIQRQRDKQSALSALGQAVELAKSANDTLAEADALNMKFEVYRDNGDNEQASKALDAALSSALESRRNARSGGPTLARCERLLARILEHYGDQRATFRATERAYEASSSDPSQLTATVLDSARRALTHGDLGAARRAAQRGVVANLEGGDLVYVALWLQLLEKKLNVASDGTVEEAYAGVDENSGWPARLRAWAHGKLSDQDLASAAHSASERTEATFYAAMLKLESGTDSSKDLDRVAHSPAIDLVEVTIARDLLAMRSKPAADYKLPADLTLP